MNPKCQACGKTVYHAERKDHEGKAFHNTCFNKWWREKQASAEGTWGGKYDIKPDVQPAYYRADDGSGQGPKMESGAQYKATSFFLLFIFSFFFLPLKFVSDVLGFCLSCVSPCCGCSRFRFLCRTEILWRVRCEE